MPDRNSRGDAPWRWSRSTGSGSPTNARERAGARLLHGYVGDGATTWRRQLDGLSDEFTVVAWDAPGAGRSSDPPERFGLDGYADCLAGFLEKSGLDTACVAGLSFGGIVALALSGDTPPCRAP